MAHTLLASHVFNGSMRRLPHAQARRVPMISCVLVQLGSPLLASSLYSFGLYCGYLMCGGAWLLIVSYVSAAMCSGACSLSSLTAFDCGTVCWSAALMGIRWRFQVDTLEVSGSFGSGPLSVIPFCHRIPITHGATSTTPSTREVAYERQEIDNNRRRCAELVRAFVCCRLWRVINTVTLNSEPVFGHHLH